MYVKLIALTQSMLPGTTGLEHSPEAIIEYAGRVCYRSESDHQKLQTTARFIQRRILEGHESIIEHASATFEVSGISRAASHQLVRHRIASYSQESQRYVDMSDPEWVVPDEIAANPEAIAVWEESLEQVKAAYRRLRDLEVKKEDARFLLPNATATRIIVTMNFRELLHVFRLRISPHAQWEIRALCVQMLEQLVPYAPNVFGPLKTELEKAHPDFFTPSRPAKA
ncbi:MAG: FAD-dependent thymidylate synthase [Anaerolineae bacterium]|nr:FAD-dependent thymidylate synthase [Anaerolineae bacterium]